MSVRKNERVFRGLAVISALAAIIPGLLGNVTVTAGLGVACLVFTICQVIAGRGGGYYRND